MANNNGIDNARNNNNQNAFYFPSNGKRSEYWYNSLNQLVKQVTPDAGLTEFFYDKAGRLTFSQNAKQKVSDRYSYTLYDAQGRIKETGAVVLEQSVFAGPSGSGGATHNTLVRNSESETASEIDAAITGKPREDVVATFYDEPLLVLSSNPGMSSQENLRKRVSSVLYVPKLLVNNSAESYYSYGTHFSYDALGNVKTLVQDNPYMDYMGQRFKRVDYDYDLLSGKVNLVSYNRGKADQFYHKYAYDADNRIVKVESSNDGLIWDRDAGYLYYKYGPLFQLEIGDLKVQTIQYAYTIQGWLKAINGDVLDAQVDMGKDGNVGSYPKDVFALALDYHTDDYKSTSGVAVTAASSSTVNPLAKNLYNGNIARQTTAIHSLDNLERTYTYDQLNRIRETEYKKVDNLTHAVVTMANAFANSYNYDKDGNIIKLTRRNEAGNYLDTFKYNYVDPIANNRLASVSDYAASTSGTDLQPGQVTNNYQYDQIGNLTKDIQGGIDNIYWNVYGKVTDIKMNGNDKLIHYDYDAMGNRVRKDVATYETGTLNGIRESDLYVRDATGNILAVYKGKSKIIGSLSIGWVNDHITNFHGSWNSAGYGLSPLLAQQFGNNGQFVSELFTTSITQAPTWSENISNSLSLTQFLESSPGIFSRAAHEPVDAYFEPLMGSGNAVEVAVALSDNINDFFMPVLSAVIPEEFRDIPDHQGMIHQTMTYMIDHAPDLSSKIATAINLPVYYGAVTADNFTQYLLDNGSSGFMSAFLSETKDSTEMVNFISNMIGDNTIINASLLSSNSNTSDALKDAVSKIKDRTTASLFFNDWLIQRNNKWLRDNTGLEERLNVVFQNNRIDFLTEYLNNIGLGEVNRAIEHIPQMTTAVYLNFVWEGVLHASLNPSYSPPTVNTPNPENIEKDTVYLAEHHLYGSNRLGIKTYGKDEYRAIYQKLSGATEGSITENTLNLQMPWFSGGFADWIKKDKTLPYSGTVYNLSLDSIRNIRILGAKQYELTDHLGNVLAVVLDKKTEYIVARQNAFRANLASVSDYYPGGMEMPGRIKTFSPYRFGNQKQEEDNEIYGDGNVSVFDYRSEDTRIVRFFSVDPLAKSYPWNSPYAFSENRLIDGVDLEGREYKNVTHWINGTYPNGDPILVKTDVEISKNILYRDKNGQDWAQTQVVYKNFATGDVIYQGKTIWEKVDNLHPKASASYDYTKDNNKEKLDDDLSYIAEHDGFPLYNWMTIVDRDGNAPDNAMTQEDLGGVEAAMVAMGVTVASNGLRTSRAVTNSMKASRACFVAGTKVWTSRGLKNIEEIITGDTVWSYNEKNKKNELNRVLSTSVHTTKNTLLINCHQIQIESTFSHLFYLDNHWSFAIDLQKGNQLKLIDGNRISIDSIIEFSNEKQVFNFEVEKNHNYYVGQSGILVHNGGPCDIVWKKVMTSKQVISELKKNGFELVGTKGSHMQFKYPGAASKITVPNHVGDIKSGTLKSIKSQVQTVINEISK